MNFEAWSNYIFFIFQMTSDEFRAGFKKIFWKMILFHCVVAVSFFFPLVLLCCVMFYTNTYCVLHLYFTVCFTISFSILLCIINKLFPTPSFSNSMLNFYISNLILLYTILCRKFFPLLHYMPSIFSSFFRRLLSVCRLCFHVFVYEFFL